MKKCNGQQGLFIQPIDSGHDPLDTFPMPVVIYHPHKTTQKCRVLAWQIHPKRNTLFFNMKGFNNMIGSSSK